jgi:hypothetical protein
MPDLGFTPRCYSGTAQKDSLVLLFGGLDGTNTILDSFDRIDIDNWNRFSLLNFSSSPRKGGMCFLANEMFYVTTGVSLAARLDETWRIDNVLKKIEIEQSEFGLFPNPSNDWCKIEFTTAMSGEIYLNSMDGRLIKQFTIENSTYFDFNTNDFAEGTYIVKLGSISKLLVIQK